VRGVFRKVAEGAGRRVSGSWRRLKKSRKKGFGIGVGKKWSLTYSKATGEPDALGYCCEKMGSSGQTTITTREGGPARADMYRKNGEFNRAEGKVGRRSHRLEKRKQGPFSRARVNDLQLKGASIALRRKGEGNRPRKSQGGCGGGRERKTRVWGGTTC